MNSSSPYTFSRKNLKMTYDLIRKKKPKLGLNLLNIIGGPPLPKSVEAMDCNNSNKYYVTLDPFEVRTIVDILLEQNRAGVENNNPEMAVICKELIDDWMRLARKMISTIPNEQRSYKY